MQKVILPQNNSYNDYVSNTLTQYEENLSNEQMQEFLSNDNDLLFAMYEADIMEQISNNDSDINLQF